jgi:predicted ATPase
LPLGIELAAARIPLLGVAGIRDRLLRRAGLPASAERDAPARQRTLREAIGWSHDLLDAAGQTLFARLSVFVGGGRIEEVESVCGPASEPGAEVIDTLADLVDQSLVKATPAEDGVRYGMLETIREYAAERLASARSVSRSSVGTPLPIWRLPKPMPPTSGRAGGAQWPVGSRRTPTISRPPFAGRSRPQIPSWD